MGNEKYPLENDYFMIPILHDVYLFRVTEIAYDNVMPDNFYKISFMLEFIDVLNQAIKILAGELQLPKHDSEVQA